ncbi:MAG: hypothetical protein ACOY42_00315 [Pseudomonadota bacterium]
MKQDLTPVTRVMCTADIDPNGDCAWSTVQTRLAAIDWSFENRVRAPAVEAIHPYPAKFMSMIALMEPPMIGLMGPPAQGI